MQVKIMGVKSKSKAFSLETETSPSIVILSTADFNSPVWTNKQHLAAGLAGAGFQVYYVESLGLRRPTFSRKDLARIFARVETLLRGNKPRANSTVLPENLHIISPRVLPFHGSPLIRWINRLLVRQTVSSRIPKPKDYVLWTFSPLTYNLEEQCRAVVYHSVDLLHTIPGVPSRALLVAERELIKRSDRVISSSTGVASHLGNMGGENVDLWENVASTELFAAAITKRIPRAIFAGNLTPTKIDFGLLRGVANAGVSVAIAGPIGIDGSAQEKELEEFLKTPGVDYLGNLSLTDLAREIGRSQVGLIPYLTNDYTRGVFPMKVFEYLSGGLSVISTDIESLEGTSVPGLNVVDSRRFVGSVTAALEVFDEISAQDRSNFASSKSWESRIKQAANLLDSLN